MPGKGGQEAPVKKMPLSQNKRGQFELRKAIYWTISIIILTIFLLGAFLVLAGYQNKMTVVPAKLRSELISLRFTNSPECFALEEKEVVVHGAIDPGKFTRERLDRCYSTEKKKGFKTFNFRLRLESSGEELITNNYFHQDKDDLTLFKEVLVKRQGRLEKDRLIIYVQEKI